MKMLAFCEYMYTDDGLYRVIYEYFETRILFGMYRTGEHLPAISETERFFHMGPTAVQSALELLGRKGYIRMDGKRTAIVVYEAEPDKIREHAAKYFALREEGIKDMIHSVPLLMGPLWLEGLRRGTNQDWDKIRNALACPSLGVISILVELYSLTLGTLKNKLILNLFWEEIRYLRFPYLTDNLLEIQETLKPEASKEEIVARLRRIFFGSYKKMVEDMSLFIRKEGGMYLIDNSRIPFQWNIYRRRPQLKYSLAGRIIWEVVKGAYPIGSYLPSLPQIAQRYDVSVATVRRTLMLLAQLGVTQSFHGKGTLVVMRTAKMNFRMPEILEGMSLYLESLQLLALTIRDITLYTIKSCSGEEQERLTEKFDLLRQENKVHLCFELYFKWIEHQCPMVMIRECYRKQYGLLTWGYPIMLYRIRNQKLQLRYMGFTEEIIKLLREKRWEDFSEAWKGLMEQEEREARKFMLDVNLRL